MAKLNLFQLTHRTNIIAGYILNWSKTRFFWFIVGVFLAILGYSAYDHYQKELFLARNQRIIDSLNAEIQIKNRENIALGKMADELDSLLRNQKNEITTIVNNFPSHQRPEITRTDSAVKFIFDFMRK